MKTSILSVSTATVVLASLAFAAPALARPSLDEPGLVAVGAQAAPSLSPDDRAVSRAAGDLAFAPNRVVGADDRALSRATVDVRGVDRIVGSDDRALPRGNPVPTFVSATTVESPDGFNWGDAGLGAGTAALALLLVGGSAAALKRTRQLGTA